MGADCREAAIRKALKHTLAASQDVAAICEPLFRHTDINTFVCIKFYPDGSRLYLSSHAEWAAHYFDQGFFDHDSHVATYGFNQSERGMSFWTGFEYDEVFSSAYEHNIWNGVTLYEKEGDVHVAYLFASTVRNHHIINFYINHVDLLNRFIFYFKEQSLKLLRSSCSDLIIPAKKIVLPEGASNQVRWNQEDCLADMQVKRYYVDSHTYLTSRELECIKWTVCGKTAEEIAIILKAAKRTVEIHLNNAKNKLGCYKVTQLAKRASDLGLV